MYILAMIYKANFLRRFNQRLAIALCMIIFSSGVLAKPEDNTFRGPVYYRYVDQSGKLVVTHSLPAGIADKGYEIISARNNQILRTVNPALTKEQLAKKEHNQIILECYQGWDKRLMQQYSQWQDIEQAKLRRLDKIQADIELLLSGLDRIRKDISSSQADAAEMQRIGRKIPAATLDRLDSLNQSFKDTEDKIVARKNELTIEEARFDRDIRRFNLIQKAKPNMDIYNPNMVDSGTQIDACPNADNLTLK